MIFFGKYIPLLLETHIIVIFIHLSLFIHKRTNGYSCIHSILISAYFRGWRWKHVNNAFLQTVSRYEEKNNMHE